MAQAGSNVEQQDIQAANTRSHKGALLQRLQQVTKRTPSRLLCGGLLFVAALALNLYRLGVPGIWFDEAFSVELARQPLPLLWHIIFGPEPNMELYYLFLHFWLALTGSLGLHQTEFVVRFPSAIFAALSTVVVFLWGRRFIGTTAGIVGAALYLLNDLQLIYAQQTRAYSLQLLLTCIAWYALLAAFTSPSHPRRWWACYIGATVLAVYTHLFSVLILFAQLVAVGGILLLPNTWRSSARTQLTNLGISVVTSTILIIPMAIVARTGAKTGWLPAPHLSDLLHLFATISGYKKYYLFAIALCSILGVVAVALSYRRQSASSPEHKQSEQGSATLSSRTHDAAIPIDDRGPINRRLLRFIGLGSHSNTTDKSEKAPIYRASIGWGATSKGNADTGWGATSKGNADTGWGATSKGNADIGWGATSKGNADIGWGAISKSSAELVPATLALLCWFVLPTIISYIVSRGSIRLFSERYLVTIVPPLCLLVGLGVTMLRWWRVQVLVSLALLLMALAAVPFYYQNAQVEDWNSTTHWLQQRYQQGDGLVCYDNSVQQGCQVSVEYYLHAYPTGAHFTADAPGMFSWANLGPANPQAGPDAAVDPAVLAAYGAKHGRIFFIVGRVRDDAAAARAQAARQWLDSHYHRLDQVVTRTVTVYLYQTNAGNK